MGRLNGAPVSFGTSPNFDRISGETIEITAVETIYFLDNIEIIEKSSLIDKIIPSSHNGDMIEWKTNPLVD